MLKYWHHIKNEKSRGTALILILSIVTGTKSETKRLSGWHFKNVLGSEFLTNLKRDLNGILQEEVGQS